MDEDSKHDLNESNVSSDKEDHIEENEETTFVRNIFGTHQECCMRCLKCNEEVNEFKLNFILE